MLKIVGHVSCHFLFIFVKIGLFKKIFQENSDSNLSDKQDYCLRKRNVLKRHSFSFEIIV